jgi:FAD/FMN-containing dehydrogenase
MVVGMGGSFSAEHGVGRLRLRQMSLYKSPVERELMTAIKNALDPAGIMNPGKTVAFD